MNEALTPSPALLGYALAFNNATLGVELLGSPKEILDELRRRKLDLAFVADHVDTLIDAAEVFKGAPGFRFTGGVHALNWFLAMPAELATINGHHAVAHLIASRDGVSPAGLSAHLVLERMRLEKTWS